MGIGSKANSFDVIVVGAGIGGLTAASLLAKAGKKVLVVEKEPRPGGYVRALVYGDYQFDTAARLIMGCSADSPLGPGPVYALLNRLGVEDQCKFVKVQPFATMYLPGLSFQMWSGRQEFIENMRRSFPSGFESLPTLLDLFTLSYRGVLTYATADLPWDFVKNPFRFSHIIQYASSNVDDVLTEHITDQRSLTALETLWPYMGLPPRYTSYIMWAAMMASYIEEGAYFCIGGLHRLADVIAGAFENQGGELLLDSEVKNITLDNNVVRGVKLANGQEFFAPTVLCNMDCRQVFNRMINPDRVPQAYRTRLERMEPSVQAVNISLVTDLDIPSMGLGYENIFYDRWDVEQIWYNYTTNGPIGMYTMTVTTVVDPFLAPPGQHLISAASFLPAGVSTDPAMAKRIGDFLLADIEKHIPGLKDHLVLAEYSSLPDGYILQEFDPIYGWAITPGQIGMGRLAQRTPFKGLYLVGHWTQPGHGVFTVVLSGMSIAKALLK